MVSSLILEALMVGSLHLASKISARTWKDLFADRVDEVMYHC